MERTLFIGNISESITRQQLMKIFRRYSRHNQPRITIIDRLFKHNKYHRYSSNCSMNCPYHQPPPHKDSPAFFAPCHRYYAFVEFSDVTETVAAWCNEHLRMVGHDHQSIEVEWSKSAKVCSQTCYKMIKEQPGYVHPDHQPGYFWNDH